MNNHRIDNTHRYDILVAYSLIFHDSRWRLILTCDSKEYEHPGLSSSCRITQRLRRSDFQVVRASLLACGRSKTPPRNCEVPSFSTTMLKGRAFFTTRNYIREFSLTNFFLFHKKRIALIVWNGGGARRSLKDNLSTSVRLTNMQEKIYYITKEFCFVSGVGWLLLDRRAHCYTDIEHRTE